MFFIPKRTYEVLKTTSKCLCKFKMSSLLKMKIFLLKMYNIVRGLRHEHLVWPTKLGQRYARVFIPVNEDCLNEIKKFCKIFETT